jgi:hypothetical protein
VDELDRYTALDKAMAGRILLCLTTGGDVTLEFPEIFILEILPADPPGDPVV